MEFLENFFTNECTTLIDGLWQIGVSVVFSAISYFVGVRHGKKVERENYETRQIYISR